MNTEPQPAPAIFREAIIDRLIQEYFEQAALPGDDDRVMTTGLFQRLIRCVLSEGYGR